MGEELPLRARGVGLDEGKSVAADADRNRGALAVHLTEQQDGRDNNTTGDERA
jgi:hypothetical protein